MIVTEENIDSAIASIRQLLLGHSYSVSHVKIDDEGSANVFVRSGHAIDNANDVEDTSIEGVRAIAIDDNIGMYFIRLGSQIEFYPDSFRVALVPTRHSSTKEWLFTVDEI